MNPLTLRRFETLTGVLALALVSCADSTTPEGPANNGGNNGPNNGVNNGTNNGVNNGTNNGVNNGTNNGVNNGTNNGVEPPYVPAMDGEVSPLSDTWPCPDGNAEEICDGLDNNCDGQADEFACECNDQTICYDGPPASQDVGACQSGTRVCDGGEFFGPCTGSVTPTDEICGDNIDSDCDGDVDEGCCMSFEICGNLVDDNCNGPVDDGCPDGQVDRFVVGEDTFDRPVDFIMAVDNSGSMDDTVREIEDSLDELGDRMSESAIDYHFVMLSRKGTDRDNPDVCIGRPLAGDNCGDSARFIHLNETIDSNTAFRDILSCYDGCDGGDGSYNAFLRPFALTQVIVVTDDESNLAWDDFAAGMQGNGLPVFVFHGIVGLRRDDCVENVGDEYINMATVTGGELVHICDNDWGRVIDVLFSATVTNLETSFVLTEVPLVETLRVAIIPSGGQEMDLFDGWIFESAANTITFLPGFEPASGDEVIVRYDYLQ